METMDSLNPSPKAQDSILLRVCVTLLGLQRYRSLDPRDSGSGVSPCLQTVSPEWCSLETACLAQDQDAESQEGGGLSEAHDASL